MGENFQVTIPVENEAEAMESLETHLAAETNEETPETPEAPAEPVEEAEAEAEPVENLEIQEPTEEAVESVIESIDMDAYTQEFTEKGELSEESTKTITDALAKAGFANPEAYLNQYLAGAQATVQNMRNAAFEVAGGEAEYGQMIQWASQNLSADQVEAFNRATRDPALLPLAVRGLHTQYAAAAQGSQPNNPRVNTGANVSSAVSPLTSREQLAELVSDPKYMSDPGFRRTADARIQASMDAGYI